MTATKTHKTTAKTSADRRPCPGCRRTPPARLEITVPVQRTLQRAGSGEALDPVPAAGLVAVQRTAGNRTVQRLLAAAPGSAAVQRNRALPERLKAGIEYLSGISMDGVSVHYNSPEPARVQAAATTQGADIHLARGAESHLPHEAWHVVQQAQGRVRPTMSLNGVAINDNPALESEANVMGTRAAQLRIDEEDDLAV